MGNDRMTQSEAKPKYVKGKNNGVSKDEAKRIPLTTEHKPKAATKWARDHEAAGFEAEHEIAGALCGSAVAK